MGVSYNPIIGVGKVFDDEQEAKEWFLSQFPEEQESIEEELDELGDGSLEEYLYSSGRFEGLEGSTLNCYSGYGFVLYFPIYIQDVKKFSELLSTAECKWEALFKEPPDIVHEVRVC